MPGTVRRAARPQASEARRATKVADDDVSAMGAPCVGPAYAVNAGGTVIQDIHRTFNRSLD